MRRATMALPFGTLLLIAACAPVERQRGYIPDQEAIKSVTVGVDTKDTIVQKLGDPSTTATFGGDVWYYMSSHMQQNAFFAPQATERNILAVEFNPDGQVANLHQYDLEDGRVVDFVSRETPTRGREMTILQQLFNAVPGNIGQRPNDIENQNPGGGN